MIKSILSTFIILTLGCLFVSGAMAQGTDFIWKLGTTDFSSKEFCTYQEGADSIMIKPELIEISAVPKGLNASINDHLKIHFSLPEVPVYGTEFRFRILNAHKVTPQMAVYCNARMAGMIQITGLGGNENVGKPFMQDYGLFIPPDKLKKGENELMLKVNRGLYANSTGDKYLWWEWDYLELVCQKEPPSSPIHGRYVNLGNAFKSNFGGRYLYFLSKWGGFAFSGNWCRGGAHFGQSLSDQQELDYLKVARNVGVYAMPLFFKGNVTRSDSLLKGVLHDSIRVHYRNHMDFYGKFYGGIEIENEPGLFGSSLEGVKKLSEMVYKERNATPHLKIVAPGWAYWPSNGIPEGWARNAKCRREIENYCDFTNGHSYGQSATNMEGGVIFETMQTYPEYKGVGFSKPLLVSEIGANDQISDPPAYGTWEHRYAANFDREIRASISYADIIMYHAALFNPAEGFYTMWDSRIDKYRFDPSKIEVWPNNNNPQETRLKTFRRLTLAYATHGRPLPFVVDNCAKLKYRPVYVRAVDSRDLEVFDDFPGEGRILINIINFDTIPQKIQTTVTMPEDGVYHGERYDDAQNYKQAFSRFYGKTKNRKLSFNVSLNSGESVQYILNSHRKRFSVKTPDSLKVKPVNYRKNALSWASLPVGSTDYILIFRDGQQINQVPGVSAFFEDYNISENRTYSYSLQAVSFDGTKSKISKSVTCTSKEMPQSHGGLIFEAEQLKHGESQLIINDKMASGNSALSNNTMLSQVNIFGIYPDQKDHVLTIRYKSDVNTEKRIVVNQGLDIGGGSTTVNLYKTDKYREARVNIELVPGKGNIIKILSPWAIAGGGIYDFFKIEPGKSEEARAEWNSINSDNNYIVTSEKVRYDKGSKILTSETAGDTISFAFYGEAFRLYSNVHSNLGNIKLKVDGEKEEIINLAEAGYEGIDRLVYEKLGMENHPHIVTIINLNNDKSININRIEILSQRPNIMVPNSDLIISKIKTIPERPKIGDKLKIVCEVKNQGLEATPENVITGIAISINGGKTGFADGYKQKISPGETVTIEQTSDLWEIPPGSHLITIKTHVNDIRRYNELSTENNTKSVKVSISD